MSGTYTVTDSPIQVVLDQGNSDISIINQGPSTIYLEANSSVSVLNGMAFAPMGQMTWNSGVPLWAICDTGATSTLLINDAAGRIDASRSRFWVQLWSQSYPAVHGITTDIVECGHTETLLIKVNETDLSGTSPDPHAITILWYDMLENIVDVDTVTINQLKYGGGSVDATLWMRLPTVGVKVKIQMNAPDSAMTNFAIFGSDRALAFQGYSGGVISKFLTDYQATAFNQRGDSFWTSGIATPYNSVISLAQLSEQVSFGIVGSGIGTAGSLDIRTTVSPGVTIASMAIPTGNSKQYFPFDTLPVKVPLSLNFSGLVGGTVNLGIMWHTEGN